MLISFLISFCVSLCLCSLVLLVIDARLRAQQKKNLLYQRQINDLSENIFRLRALVKTRGLATEALVTKISRVERAP